MKLKFDKIASKGKSAHNLLILHGLFGNKMNFRSLAKRAEMSGTADVYLLDLRNHGESGHSDSMKIKDCAKDLQQFMDDHELERAAIFGHSLGGRVAMQASFDMPDRIVGLVVGDIAPVDYTKISLANHDLINYLAGVDLQSLGSRQSVKRAIVNYLGGGIAASQVADFLMTNVVEDENKLLRWRINLPVLRRDYEAYNAFIPDVGSTYDGPLAVIYGTQSEFMPPRIFPEFKKYFPNIDLDKDFKSIDGGHWIHSVNPELFLRYMKEFMDRLTK